MDSIFREEQPSLTPVTQSRLVIKKRYDLGSFWAALFVQKNVTQLSKVISTLAIKIGLNAMQHRQLRKLLKKAVSFTPQVDPDSLQEQDLLNFLYVDADEVHRRSDNSDLTFTELSSLKKVLNSLAKWLAKLTKTQQHRIELLQQRAFHLSMG